MAAILTDSDKAQLLDWGHLERDLPQLEEAAKRAKYTIYGKDGHGKLISRENLMSFMEHKDWLSGISRSAFHRTAARTTKDGLDVLFEVRW